MTDVKLYAQTSRLIVLTVIVAPPPELKRVTDKELEQRYRIHLATRLQSDEPGKQANWVDIHDYRDDNGEACAPESIGFSVGIPQFYTLSNSERASNLQHVELYPAYQVFDNKHR